MNKSRIKKAFKGSESFLVMVSVALGISVVVAVFSFTSILHQVRAHFTSYLYFKEVTLADPTGSMEAFRNSDGSVKDLQVLSGPVEQVKLQLSDIQRARQLVAASDHVYGMQPWSFYLPGQKNHVQAFAVTLDYLHASQTTALQGRLPSAQEFEEAASVCVISARLFQELGGNQQTLESPIQFENYPVPLKVVGVFSSPAYSPFIGRQADIILPLNPQHLPLSQIKVATPHQHNLPQLKNTVQDLNRRLFQDRLGISQAADIKPILNQAENASRLVASFASIGLLIAAANIMNVMLARVFRRRMEIGVHRSVGASARNVFWMFFGESLLLGAAGGVLGIGLSSLLLLAFNHYLGTIPLEQRPGVNAIPLSLESVFYGVTLALLTSMVFGLLPAVHAARVKVVEVLK